MVTMEWTPLPQRIGFIKGRSTTLQLLKVMDIWTESLESGGRIDAIFILILRKLLIKFSTKD